MRLLQTSALALLPLLASCASILQSGPDVVHFTTEPPGATVYLDEAIVGETPCQATVKRSAGGQVRFEEPGYHPVSFRLPTSTNGFIVGNIIWGYLAPIGVLVDVMSGNGSAWVTPGQVRMVRVDADPLSTEAVAKMVKPQSAKAKTKESRKAGESKHFK